MEVAGEEEACDIDDPFAMMGGMGEEEVYRITLMEEASELPEAGVEEILKETDDAEEANDVTQVEAESSGEKSEDIVEDEDEDEVVVVVKAKESKQENAAADAHSDTTGVSEDDQDEQQVGSVEGDSPTTTDSPKSDFPQTPSSESSEIAQTISSETESVPVDSPHANELRKLIAYREFGGAIPDDVVACVAGEHETAWQAQAAGKGDQLEKSHEASDRALFGSQRDRDRDGNRDRRKGDRDKGEWR